MWWVDTAINSTSKAGAGFYVSIIISLLRHSRMGTLYYLVYIHAGRPGGSSG